MDFKTLFLDPNGRIGQKDFWIGFAILVGVSIVVSILFRSMPLLQNIVSLLLIFPFYCLAAKRLHDIGKSERLAHLACLAQLVIVGLSLILGVMGVGVGASVAAGSLAGAGAFAGVAMLVGLISLPIAIALLVFLIWIGVTKGEESTNQYGSPRTPPLTGA